MDEVARLLLRLDLAPVCLAVADPEPRTVSVSGESFTVPRPEQRAAAEIVALDYRLIRVRQFIGPLSRPSTFPISRIRASAPPGSCSHCARVKLSMRAAL